MAKHTTTRYTYSVHMEMCKKREGFFELGKAPHLKREIDRTREHEDPEKLRRG